MCDRFGFDLIFVCIASLQQSDLRLSGPPPGQGASGGARTRNRWVTIYLKKEFFVHWTTSSLEATDAMGSEIALKHEEITFCAFESRNQSTTAGGSNMPESPTR
ncbi:hypothetical protein PoB_006292000 [Plakobranchus ocellatus]|uniref:Uncharacterized protein n=1 Tax=Plakobranchus ocellatus TaxID=259542 RepID=A0AAV4CX01_9GAST|nr:hypothetical protein PoB_006292000 [Plakobranchus ocellatus]